MRYKKIKVPVYDWQILYIRIESKEDIKEFNKVVKNFGFNSEIDFELDKDNITNDKFDGGCCTYNDGYKKMVIVVYRCENFNELMSVLFHECDHAVWNILEHCNVNDKEARAYLSGYIGTQLCKDIQV
jgi:hypothetical protein